MITCCDFCDACNKQFPLQNLVKIEEENVVKEQKVKS